jgi:hypothetical protein
MAAESKYVSILILRAPRRIVAGMNGVSQSPRNVADRPFLSLNALTSPTSLEMLAEQGR